MVAIVRLNQTRPEYDELAPIWQQISDIRGGAAVLLKKVEQYLPRRACEDDELYRLRVAKFSYTPIYNNAVRELVAKLLTEPITIEGDDSEWWTGFYKDMDGLGLTEPQFMQQLYNALLHFGKIYIAVDRPTGEVPKVLSQLATAPKPFVRLFEPLDVITWADDNKWYVTRQLFESVEPFSPAVTMCRWTLWASGQNEVYECPVRLNEGIITQVMINTTWMNINDRRAMLEPTVVTHGLTYPPMLSLKLDAEEWLGNACFLKQLQHCRIESQWTEAGSVAGTIQRVFTPMPPTPDDDERVTFTQQDYSGLVSSNQHILIGSGFQFVESSGAAIGALGSQLDAIKQSILDIVSMSYKSASTELGTVQQSGVSKEVDMMSLDDTVSSYTVKVTPLYEKLLNLVAVMGGQSSVITAMPFDTEKDKDNGGNQSYTEDDVTSVMSQLGLSREEAIEVLRG